MTPPRISRSYAALALAWLLGAWLVVDLSSRLGHLRRDAAAAQQHVMQFQALAARKPRLAAAYQAYAAVFGPAVAGRQAFFEELESCADASMQLNLKPQTVRGGKGQMGVEVELEATQDALLAFLDRVFALPSLIELERLQIAPAASPEHPLKASLLVSKQSL